MDPNMKSDWEERAQRAPEYYIATAASLDEFVASGAKDVSLFFQGVESLLTPTTRVLDIGCGIGRMDQHVAPRVGHLTGIDVSGTMVRLARERLAPIVSNVEFVEGDGWTLQPLPDASMDLIFSHIVFQHMPRRVAQSYLADAMRVLRPGGNFLFQMPEANESTPKDPEESDTFEMRFYEESDLRARLEDLGFEWVGSLRHEIESEGTRFNQMRLHATKPMA